MRVGHDAVARVELDFGNLHFKRQHARLRVVAQHGSAQERGDVHAARRRGRPLAEAGYRAVHRAGNVRADDDVTRETRHVLHRDFHRVLQRFADGVRHGVAGRLVGGQQLVRHDARLGNGVLVGELGGDAAHDAFVVEKAVAGEGVEALPHLLP